jgi:hypothetical protein
MQPAIPSNSVTPLADMLEPTLQRLEAQLPPTRHALEAERRRARSVGLQADEEER